MIPITSGFTEAPHVQLVTVTPKSDQEALFRYPSSFLNAGSSAANKASHPRFATCMSTLTADGRCAFCAREFEP